MSYSAEIIDYKGKEAVALTAGKYKAIVAPFLGSNVLRMQDVENGIEIFRYDESLSVEELKKKFQNEKIEMDSFELFEFVVAIEEEFGIEYDEFDELTFHMTNLQNLLDYLTAYIKNH